MSVRYGAAATVVLARGEVEVFTAPLLIAAMRDALRRSNQVVIVDLTSATLLGSGRLGALADSLDQAQRHRCRFLLAGIAPAVMAPPNVSDRYKAG